MFTSWRIALVAACVGSILIVSGASWIYWASRRVPDFYEAAVSQPSEEQTEARDEFVSQATALASDANRFGSWQCLFTAEQINAWLALELATNYPGMLPPELHEPRIEIVDREATIACRYEIEGISTVLSLTLEVSLRPPSTLAVRVRRARAGALPVPLAKALDAISQAARQLELRLEWSKSQGDPIALISIPHAKNAAAQTVELRAVEFRDGELFVSGVTSRGSPQYREVSSADSSDELPESPAVRMVQELSAQGAKETRQE